MNEIALMLKKQIEYVLYEYNDGRMTSYAENMLYGIDQILKGDTDYVIYEYTLTRKYRTFGVIDIITWDIRYVLGECILNNDHNFFNKLK